MSTPDSVGNDTLELLDHVPPKLRQRYIEKLSKEVMVAVIVAVCQEREEARTETTDEGSPSNKSRGRERDLTLPSRTLPPKGIYAQCYN
jgi:hypothetical protein